MKKLFTLFLVLATTFALVGCGSSGGSSGVSNDLDTLLKNQALDFNFDININDSMAANLRGNAFDIDTLANNISATIYKSNNGVRNNDVKHTIDKSKFTKNGIYGFKVNLSLMADNETLKELLLSNLYEVVVQNGDKPMLRAFINITDTEKLNALTSKTELLQSINSKSTAKAALFEDRKKHDSAITNYDDFIALYINTDKLEDAIEDLTYKIVTLLTENKDLYDENGTLTSEFSNAVDEIITEHQTNQNQGGEGQSGENQNGDGHPGQNQGDDNGSTGKNFVLTGTISGGGITGNSEDGINILYFVVATKKDSNGIWKIIGGNDYTMPISPGTSSYTLTVSEGTYKIRVVRFGDQNDDNKTPLRESDEIVLTEETTTWTAPNFVIPD